MKFHIGCGFLCMVLVIGALGPAGSAQTPAGDWAQWRGAGRDGVIAARHAPAAWPDREWAPRWTVEVSEGYASPVAAGGRLFIHSRQDPQEVVTALDAATGKPVWTQRYTAAFTKNQYANQMAKGPNATPLVADGRLFTRTGADLWSIPFPDEWHENIVTPIWTGTHLIVSGTRQGTQAYALSKSGELGLVPLKAGAYVRERVYEVSTRATYAVPAFLDGDLIVRDATHVTRLSGARGLQPSR